MPNDNRFHPRFALDLAAGTAYYDNISDQLGDRFRGSVKQTLATIRQRPESFGCVANALRAAMVPSFPYVVLFRVSDGTLFFAGLFHAASDPNRWFEREGE